MPYKAFSLEAKLVANRFCASNMLCFLKGLAVHTILGRDEEGEEKRGMLFTKVPNYKGHN